MGVPSHETARTIQGQTRWRTVGHGHEEEAGPPRFPPRHASDQYNRPRARLRVAPGCVRPTTAIEYVTRRTTEPGPRPLHQVKGGSRIRIRARHAASHHQADHARLGQRPEIAPVRRHEHTRLGGHGGALALNWRYSFGHAHVTTHMANPSPSGRGVPGRMGRSPGPALSAVQRCCGHLMTGSVSNWWNGGGLDRVHSSVVAPSPQ